MSEPARDERKTLDEWLAHFEAKGTSPLLGIGAWTCGHGTKYSGSDDFISGARNAHAELEPRLAAVEAERDEALRKLGQMPLDLKAEHERAEAAERRVQELESALRELVRLKDEKAARQTTSGLAAGANHAYQQEKDAAWEVARSALPEPSSSEEGA